MKNILGDWIAIMKIYLHMCFSYLTPKHKDIQDIIAHYKSFWETPLTLFIFGNSKQDVLIGRARSMSEKEEVWSQMAYGLKNTLPYFPYSFCFILPTVKLQITLN